MPIHDAWVSPSLKPPADGTAGAPCGCRRFQCLDSGYLMHARSTEHYNATCWRVRRQQEPEECPWGGGPWGEVTD